MTLIKKKIKITVSDEARPTEKTIQYFKKSGFKQSYTSEMNLLFKRGTVFSNMWTFNPLKWKSEIRVKINGEEIEASFTIDASGQIPTLKEEKLWEDFIENYKRYLTEKEFDFKSENKIRLKAIKKDSLKYVGWALIGGIIGGIPSLIIAYWTGMYSIISMGSGIGAIGLLMKKINDDKKKNAI